MRLAKSGNWQENEKQRRLANISTVYTEKPDFQGFMKEWLSLYESKAGERGIVNRKAFQKKLEGINRKYFDDMGLNPCGEVILRAFQACNLTEIIVRPTDSLKDLKRKVRLATIIGTLQSGLTDFRYLRKIWKQNCEEERLLGVSITGIMDHGVLSQSFSAESWLAELKVLAVETNKKWAKKIGISPAKAITCIKPSGTVSQLVNSSSGIHPRFSDFYKRVVINDINDPLGKFMADRGVPHTTDQNCYYFEFPQKAPKTSKKVEQVGAMEQLELWKTYATVWCDHNPSQTIYYTDDEFLKVGQWVWENFDIIGGLSFFPVDNHIYEHPPYTKITEVEFKAAQKAFPYIRWGDFTENLDMTTGAKELACGGGQCEV
jgi:ribonucleoside-diphosphate reductase alpha chain